MSNDPFKNHFIGLTSPASDWFPITPGQELESPVRAIRASTAGTVTVVTTRGAKTRTLNFLAGETRTIMASAVTDATAQGLEGGV